MEETKIEDFLADVIYAAWSFGGDEAGAAEEAFKDRGVPFDNTIFTAAVRKVRMKWGKAEGGAGNAEQA